MCLRRCRYLFFSVTLLCTPLPLMAAELHVEQTDRGAVVRIDDEVYCEYRTDLDHQPAIWPVNGPTGKPMTRSFPLGPLLDEEKDDHPHHMSLWFAHGDMNGHDFWVSPSNENPYRIAHRDFSRVENVDGEAVIVARNDWIAGTGKKVCEDERMFVFGTDGDARYIDAAIKIVASEGDLTLGDTKEGSFSVRVAGTMKTDAQMGGQIVNSRGTTDKQAWGEPAAWVDYHGPVGGETLGVAIFSHPTNFRPVCRWHVRLYGLFAANPFGEHHFEEADLTQGALTIAAGESLTLRYRVYLHRGDTASGRVAEAFEKYAAKP